MGSWLLVSIWGDPGGWSEVEYRVPDLLALRRCKLSDVGALGGGYRYRSTLGALTDAYRERVSRCVVYVADTLALSDHALGRCASACGGFEDYGDVLGCVERYVSSVLDDEGYVRGDLRGRVEVRVLPGVGAYRRRRDGLAAEFAGSPANYYYGLLVDLYRRLSGSGADTVVLDVSHGVNFMPVLGFKAAAEAVRLYALERGEEVRLIALNSDPVTPGTADVPRNVHVVHCRVLGRKEALREVAGELRGPARAEGRPFAMLRRERPPPEAEGLKRVHDRIEREVREGLAAVLASLEEGLPLPLAYALEELERADAGGLLDELVGAVERLVGRRRVRSDGGTLRVEHTAAATEAVEHDLRSLALLRALELDRRGLGSIVRRWRGSEVRMYRLGDLGRLAEERAVGRAAEALVRSEVSGIEERVRAYEALCGALEGPVLYKRVYDLTESCVEVRGAGCRRLIEVCRRGREALGGLEVRCPGAEPRAEGAGARALDKRAFYAHAGFSREVTLVARGDDGELYVGYAPDAWRSVLSILAGATGPRPGGPGPGGGYNGRSRSIRPG